MAEDRDLEHLFRELHGLRVELRGLTLRVPEVTTSAQRSFLRHLLEAQAFALSAIPSDARLPVMTQLRLTRVPIVLAAALTPGGQTWSPGVAQLVASTIAGAGGTAKRDLAAIADQILAAADLPCDSDPDADLNASGLSALLAICGALRRSELDGMYTNPGRL